MRRWRVAVACLIRQALDNGTIEPHRRSSAQPGGRRREPAEFEPEEPTSALLAEYLGIHPRFTVSDLHRGPSFEVDVERIDLRSSHNRT
jgi:hypothetical protein